MSTLPATWRARMHALIVKRRILAPDLGHKRVYLKERLCFGGSIHPLHSLRTKDRKREGVLCERRCREIEAELMRVVTRALTSKRCRMPSIKLAT
jgi:hypothetical protein